MHGHPKKITVPWTKPIGFTDTNSRVFWVEVVLNIQLLSEVDLCFNHLCNRGVCSIVGPNYIPSYPCHCDTGYTGQYCDLFIGGMLLPSSTSAPPLRCFMSINPCNGRGRCIDNFKKGYRCRCIAGFGGRYCQIHEGKPVACTTVLAKPTLLSFLLDFLLSSHILILLYS